MTTGFVIDALPRTNNKLRTWKLRHWEKLRWTKLIEEVAGHGPWFVREDHSIESYATWPVRLGVVVHRRKLQDPDNRVASMKPVLDALKTLGWLVDDSSAWLDLHVWEHKCADGEQRTEIVWDMIIKARTLQEAPRA